MRGRLAWTIAVAAVLAVEAAVCAWVGGAGGRLRLWVNTLSVQGIVLALIGTFLLVDRPFAAVRAVRGSTRPRPSATDGEDRRARRGGRRRSGWALLLAGLSLFGGAALIWSAMASG